MKTYSLARAAIRGYMRLFKGLRLIRVRTRASWKSKATPSRIEMNPEKESAIDERKKEILPNRYTIVGIDRNRGRFRLDLDSAYRLYGKFEGNYFVVNHFVIFAVVFRDRA